MKTIRLDGRRLKHGTLTEIRRRAVAQVQAGESPETVIRTLGMSRPCIYNWLAMYRAGGWDALDARKRGGRPRKLTGKMLAFVYQAVTGGDPRQYRFPFALWTRQMVATLIRRTYGIQLSRNSTGRLLANMGISPQKPLWRAYQQDAQRVQKWVTEDYPAIAREARKIGAEIWFGDEAGMRSDYHKGTTWARKGQTPVIRTTGARYSLNMISAVNRTGKMRFMIHAGKVASAVFGEFLDRLMAGSDKIIFLIVDGHPIHKSAGVARKVSSFNGRLRLYHLPPSSPELNPDEQVWNEVKSKRAGRQAVESFAAFKAQLLGALRHVAKRPDKVRSFFCMKDTQYAA